MEFFCSVCNNGRDYKTIQNLNEHKKTASHKRKVDAEFAEAEKAEKATFKAIAEAAKVAKKDEAEKAAKKAAAEEAEKLLNSKCKALQSST